MSCLRSNTVGAAALASVVLIPETGHPDTPEIAFRFGIGAEAEQGRFGVLYSEPHGSQAAEGTRGGRTAIQQAAS